MSSVTCSYQGGFSVACLGKKNIKSCWSVMLIKPNRQYLTFILYTKITEKQKLLLHPKVC